MPQQRGDMNKEERRLKALNEIREHIAKHGFHTYVVTGGGYPHFGYTIGLTESLGAELIWLEVLLSVGRYFRSDPERQEYALAAGRLECRTSRSRIMGHIFLPQSGNELGNRAHAWSLRLLSGKKHRSLTNRSR
jgi:hypothetical protein